MEEKSLNNIFFYKSAESSFSIGLLMTNVLVAANKNIWMFDVDINYIYNNII